MRHFSYRPRTAEKFEEFPLSKVLHEFQYSSIWFTMDDLTADELKRLAATPCDIDVLKRESLFSCLTGLRIIDILNLKWEDSEIAPDQGFCIKIHTQIT